MRIFEVAEASHPQTLADVGGRGEEPGGPLPRPDLSLGVPIPHAKCNKNVVIDHCQNTSYNVWSHSVSFYLNLTDHD